MRRLILTVLQLALHAPLVGLLLLLSTTAHADLLTDVRNRLTDAPVLRGEFLQTRQLAGIRKPLVAEGRFLVLRGQGVLWQTDKPFAQSLRVTPRELLQKDARGQTTRLSTDKEPVVATVSQVLMAVLGGDLAPLARLFEVKGSLDAQRWQLVLSPRQAGMAQLISEIRLTGNTLVDSVTLLSPGGDQTHIEMRRHLIASQPSAADTAAFE